MLSLMGCETMQTEARAAAAIAAAQPVAREHATALVGDDVNAMRSTGLELITIVRCGSVAGCLTEGVS